MRCHFTPNSHLKRFAIAGRPYDIFQYDKDERRYRTKATKNVGFENKFYPDNVEVELNLYKERPGNKCIDKVLSLRDLDRRERSIFSDYVFNLHARGRYSRKRSQRIIAALVQEERRELELWRSRLIFESSQIQDIRLTLRAQKLLPEIERALSVVHLGSEFINTLTNTPHDSNLGVMIISEMDWHFVKPAEGTFFVTGDTAATFFESYGLLDDRCEITITISKSLAMIGTNYNAHGRTFWHFKDTGRFTEEINRRIVSTCDRYIYSPERVDWIPGFSLDPSLQSKCSRILW